MSCNLFVLCDRRTCILYSIFLSLQHFPFFPICVRTQLDKYIRDHRSLAEREEKLERLEKQLDTVLKEHKDAELKIAELRQRVTSLQQELDTSEAVQKDFVRLSQSLQVHEIIEDTKLRCVNACKAYLHCH